MGDASQQGSVEAGAATPQDDELVGQIIDGRYRVESVLGEGGMGLVYRGTHAVLGKPLAIKVLRADVSKNEEIIARFRQEAQSATSIGNEHIVDISDFGTLPSGATYFTMEYLDGMELSRAVREQGAFELPRAIRVGRQIAEALAAAHQAGIVHRDLKPDNVFLVRRGTDGDFVKVLDFGIAKVSNSSSKLTRAGEVFGTPHYMSPEQCAGNAVDQRTDIYALGVILYELVTGKVPFDAENVMGVLTKHLYEPPVPPSQQPTGAHVPAALDALIMRCLSKDVDGRPGSMDELIAALDGLDGPGSQSGIGAPRPAVARDTGAVSVPQRKRGPALAAVGALVVVAGAGGAWLFASGSDGAEESAAAPEPAESAPREEPPPSAAEEGAAPGASDEGAGASDESRADRAASAVEPMDGQEEHTETHGSTETSKVTVGSDPEQAEVWRGDALIGNTPVELPRPQDGEVLEIELRKRGYRAQGVRLSSLTQESVRVTLEQEPSRRRRARARSRPSSASERRKSRRQQNDDSTSKPSSGSKKEPGPTRPSLGGSEVLDPWAGGD